jgi:hypothetical protein
MEPKVCKDCIYHKHDVHGGYQHICLADAIKDVDLVTGKVTYLRTADCYQRREFGAICGETGKLFKPRDEEVSDD